MTERWRGVFAIPGLFLLLFIFAAAAIADPPGPMEIVKQTVNEARAVFNNSRLSEEARIEKLKEIAKERFDFEEMSKQALALQWRKLTPGQRSEFVSLFSKLIENTYSDKVKRYRKEIEQEAGDRVLYLGQRIDGPYATVRTKVITTKGTEVPVDYRFINESGSWRAYDVIVEGVSLINNYRSQFREILTSGSYDELARKLKEKVQK
jgi:phospholipid transport system substrate-binding protein